MRTFDADLHIHSRHSIGVSKSMTIPELSKNAKLKGIDLIGTGDVTQPDWLAHVKKNMKEFAGAYQHAGISYLLTVEIEDCESIHHLILLPDFESVDTLRNSLRGDSPNLEHEWGGRPRVNLNGEELAGIVRDAGGLIGPAHAFTPFRSIFRENKHSSLASCYGAETQFVRFLELGLSADSEIADCIPELRRLTYISSSDAHSPAPNKLGREFVRLQMEAPTFSELRLAILREKGRRPTLNVGFDPRLGKYYLSFCSSCRRTLMLRGGDDPPSFDGENIYVHVKSPQERVQLFSAIHKRAVKCPADGKPLRLGVRDRAAALGGGLSQSPLHRPPYLRTAPLLDVIASSIGVKSSSSRRARSIYMKIVESLGPETRVLTEIAIEDIKAIDSRVAQMVDAYRNGTAAYVAGGGGRYGRILPPWEGE